MNRTRLLVGLLQCGAATFMPRHTAEVSSVDICFGSSVPLAWSTYPFCYSLLGRVLMILIDYSCIAVICCVNCAPTARRLDTPLSLSLSFSFLCKFFLNYNHRQLYTIVLDVSDSTHGPHGLPTHCLLFLVYSSPTYTWTLLYTS